MKRENREQFSTQHILQQYDELLVCKKIREYCGAVCVEHVHLSVVIPL